MTSSSRPPRRLAWGVQVRGLHGRLPIIRQTGDCAGPPGLVCLDFFFALPRKNRSNLMKLLQVQESVETAEASIRDNMLTQPEAALEEIKALYRKLEVNCSLYCYCTVLWLLIMVR